MPPSLHVSLPDWRLPGTDKLAAAGTAASKLLSWLRLLHCQPVLHEFARTTGTSSARCECSSGAQPYSRHARMSPRSASGGMCAAASRTQ